MFLLFVMIHHLPLSSFFPYTTLFRSRWPCLPLACGCQHGLRGLRETEVRDDLEDHAIREAERAGLVDRKSTRLNSSHITISYAVFCLKKKKDLSLLPLFIRRGSL